MIKMLIKDSDVWYDKIKNEKEYKGNLVVAIADNLILSAIHIT